jgi:hypothetical protein
MADTRITINCEDHGEDCTIIKVTAERDYKPIFTEAFYSTEKPLGVHLIERKVINGEMPGKAGSEQVLSKSYRTNQKGNKDESTGIYPRRIGFEISNHRLSYHQTV